MSPSLQVGALPLSHLGSPRYIFTTIKNFGISILTAVWRRGWKTRKMQVQKSGAVTTVVERRQGGNGGAWQKTLWGCGLK